MMKILSQHISDRFERQITVIKLQNKKGVEVWLTNYGATILNVFVPESSGTKKDVVLGYNTIDDLLGNHEQPEKYYFGATVGRYANRIAYGQFTIDETTYQLSRNEKNNHLHGGRYGLNKAIWNFTTNSYKNSAIFVHQSPDGEEGYPGNLIVRLQVSLTEENEIKLDYRATSDKATPVNLTNHTYFNLNGGGEDVLNHRVKINSQWVIETNEQNIPTGKKIPVGNSPFDLRSPILLGKSSVIKSGGFDHCFVIEKQTDDPEFVAKLTADGSPVSIEIYTTEPSIQFYTAGGFDGSFTGKGNNVYNKFQGLCLEAQNFPDSPNHNNFPNSILKPGEEYRQTTSYIINIDHDYRSE